MPPLRELSSGALEQRGWERVERDMALTGNTTHPDPSPSETLHGVYYVLAVMLLAGLAGCLMAVVRVLTRFYV